MARTAATLTLSLEAVDAGELTRLAGQQLARRGGRVFADLRRKAEASAPTQPSILEHLAASHEDEENNR